MSEAELEKILRKIQKADGNKVNRVRKQLFEEEDEDEWTPRMMRRIKTIPPKQSVEKEEEELEIELTGHVQHLAEEVDDEEELVYTLQQLVEKVKHEKRTHAVLSRVIRNNLCEDIAKAIEKMDCISTLEVDLMEDIPSSQVMVKEKMDCI